MMIFFKLRPWRILFKKFIEILNAFLLTIKPSVKCSKVQINYLDVNVRLKNSQIEIDSRIKKTDTHQLLDSTSCQPYHCNKSISFGKALRYSRIYSENEKFDQSFNDLEKWLM